VPSTRITENTSSYGIKPGNYYSHIRPEILELIPLNAATMLDIGCGNGSLSRAVKNRQIIEAHGIEITKAAADIAKSQLDVVWNDTVENALKKLEDNYYDCIVLADVLEHLIDPWSVLEDLKSKLTATGKLVISVPNIQNWRIISKLKKGRWDYTSDGILDRTHLRFFTRQTTIEMLWNTGFKINTTRQIIRDPTQPKKFLKPTSLPTKENKDDSLAYQICLQAEVPKPKSIEPTISIIIVNWNGKEDTINCITSLNQLNYTNYEVIIVDNGSTDDSVKAIKTAFPNISIIEEKNNTGFSGGNNIGIKYALESSSDYILLLNNDTVTDKELLKKLIQSTNLLPDGSVLGPKIFYFDRPKTLWFAGGQWIDEENRFVHLGDNEPDGPNYNSIKEVDYITGCALFASRKTFEEVGLLDEDFFLTYEETDWCYRARKKGLKCIFVPEAKLMHKVASSFGGRTSPMYSYFMTRNLMLWAKKHLDLTDRASIQKQIINTSWHKIVPNFVLPEDSNHLIKRILWGLSSWKKTLTRNFSDPTKKATIIGLRDYYLRRFGNCPEIIRRISNKNTK
jgi:GT2 family glycosyltransferase/2-polyprenyl-3-methyl-5-hydroxy-6-metoxy-1,4-benzoquinol methylase